MIYIAAAILSGVTIVLARVLNYLLAERIGVWQGNFFNYVLGLGGSILIMLFSGETMKLFSIEAYSATWWAYTGGLLGVAVIALSSILSGKISAFYLTLLLFIGQLFTGMLLDFITLYELSLYKIAGGALVVIGLGYNLIVDKKSEKAEA